MRSLPSALLLATLVLAFSSTAAGVPAGANGVVSFGSCCGSATGIYVIQPNGLGLKRIFAPGFDDASLVSAWSPDGTRLAYVAPGGLWTMSPAGKSGKRLTKGLGDTLAPTWSPDGKRIAFVDLASRHGSNYAIYVIHSDGTGKKRIVGGAKYQNNPAWSPSGKVIMFERGSSLWTVRPDGKGQKKIGEGSSPSWAPDGQRVAFDRRADLWTMNADGSGAKLVIDVPSSTAGIAWSPDGNWIAYAIADRSDLLLVHPDGTGGKHLTHEPDLFHSEPAWQPKP
ncbi:MAG: PD40 domain-containing protein [Actinobacteria bacterium]|nr:PD40 domain-containing protein [Actinomycetota bacterium]